MSSTSKNNSKEPLIRIYSTPKLKKRMKPRRLTMPANLRNPQKNVDEIVKRYSMQLKAKSEEKLSDECLEEINTLEKSFQELDSFELQVESVKNPPNEDVDNEMEEENTNNKDEKKKEKSAKIGKNIKKAKKTQSAKNNNKLHVQNDNKPTHRRSIRHLSS
ncbi:hypothetical protein ACQ4LE_009101 [Meloidogyne hapla]|uniref:Uncharacterized protein n=1 Tax=Meloidogyne hapla TaxID=6305 RepID=A0A1I8B6B6_MELHA